jgi:hypothetical protein
MSTFTQILIGALGGLAAVCAKFLGQDYQTTLVLVVENNSTEIFQIGVGYAIVTPILMFLGGLLGWASRETQPLKLIAIGVAAPGLITTWSGTSDISKLSTGEPKRAGIFEMLSPVTPALAQEFAQVETTPPIAIQSEGKVLQRGLQTFFNLTPEPKFWVIVGSFTDREQASALAGRINAEAPQMDAFVGLRQPGNPYYPVIVGDYQTAEVANQLKEQAVKLQSVRAQGGEAYLSSFAERRP